VRAFGSRIVVGLVLLAVLAAACTSGQTPPSPSPSSVAAGETPFGTGDVSVVVERLAQAGIATYATADGAPIVAPVEPVSVVRLLDWQARNLALEAWAGNGQLGSRLDTLGGAPPPGAPTNSQWLAAYVGGVETPGADYARELLGTQDLRHPEAVEFPQLVSLLFASDAAVRLLHDPEPAGGSPTTTPAALGPGGETTGPAFALAAFNPCGDFSNFISEVMGDVIKALHIPPARIGDTGSTFLNQLLQTGANLVVNFLNWAIGGVITILVGGVRAALKPILDAIASVSSVLAIASQILGALRPWAVRLVPEQTSVHKSVGGNVVTDPIQAIVDLGGLTEWPPALMGCAKLVNVTLPPLKPIGAPVTWTVLSVPAGLATDEHHDPALLEDPVGGKAELRLRTGPETLEEHEKGKEGTGLVNVKADIRRSEFKDLKDAMVGLATSLLAGLPDLVRGTAQRLLKAPIDAVMEEVVSLADEHGSVSVAVTYHGPPGPSPSPSISIAAGGLTGTWAGTAHSHFGDNAGFTVELQQTGSKLSGQLHIPSAICNKEATVSGTVSGSNLNFGVSQGADLTATFTGTVSSNNTAMSGTWQSPAGGSCRSDYGTWEATKTA
jgi:hypothetical protein